MHHDLNRFDSRTIEQIPHHELLVATHSLAIELMISSALPQNITKSWQPFAIKREEDGTEYRIFRGILDIHILGIPFPDKLNDMLISCETSLEIAEAVKLRELTPSIRSFATIEYLQDKARIVVRGSMGLVKLQGALGKFFWENIPSYKLPFGLDTEIYVNPNKSKFKDMGFKPVSTHAPSQ